VQVGEGEPGHRRRDSELRELPLSAVARSSDWLSHLFPTSAVQTFVPDAAKVQSPPFTDHFLQGSGRFRGLV
jgi:hypothetical protein